MRSGLDRHRLFDERVTTDAKPPRRTHTPLAYFVYVVKNDIDNSVYFGRTGNWQSRWLSHLSCAADHRSNHPLYVAMRKLGVDHFTLSVLHVTMDIQESKDLEAKYINAARDRGMNVYNCGECANFGVVRHMVAIAKKRLAKEWGLIP